MERRKGVSDNSLSRLGLEGSESKIFLDPAEAPIPPIQESNFFDNDMLKTERHLLSQEVDLASEHLKKRDSIPSSRDAARWNDLNLKVMATLDLTKEVDDMFEKVEAAPENYNYGILLRLSKMSLGVDLLRHVTFKDLLAISKKHHFDDKYAPFATLTRFSTAPELSICVGSISLPDFMTVNKKTTNPTPYYRYLVEMGSDAEDAPQQIFEQNQDHPKNLYPNFTKQAIINMQDKLNGVFVKDEDFENTLPRFWEGIKLFDRVAEGVQNIRDKTYQSVFNPASEEFSDLSTLIQQYLHNPDKRTRMNALYLMGLDTREKTIEAYRKARKYKTKEGSGVFYNVLADSIAEYIEELSSFANILSNDDVAAILSTDAIEVDEEKSEPTFEELGKKVNEIFNKTSRPEFKSKIDDINWALLQVPEEAQIHFDPNRQRKFTINITFNNELGESTEVECTLDTTKNSMDWNHPEDPMLLRDDQNLRSLRRSLLIATQFMLDNLYRQAQEEYQLKRQSEGTNPTVVVQRPKRERAQDPVYQLRKDTKAQQREESIDKGSLFEVLSQKEEIKNRVILSSDEEFEDMVRYLSHVDREIVRRSIEEYNEKGTGAKFTRKKKAGTEGELVYGLSIRCTVPKGARILLREAEPGDGTRNFEIIDIRYRKDIYSKHNL